MDTNHLSELANRLEECNLWRRGGDGPMPDPASLGRDLDAAVAWLRRLAAGGVVTESIQQRESNPMVQIPYCINCVHYRLMEKWEKLMSHHRCAHPDFTSPVTGEPTLPNCEQKRGKAQECRPEGRLFSPRELD